MFQGLSILLFCFVVDWANVMQKKLKTLSHLEK